MQRGDADLFQGIDTDECQARNPLRVRIHGDYGSEIVGDGDRRIGCGSGSGGVGFGPTTTAGCQDTRRDGE